MTGKILAGLVVVSAIVAAAAMYYLQVYAFYDPDFSFKDLIAKYPELGGDVTDCLSGDVNKDFSHLWEKIQEFCSIPKDLPHGEPLTEHAQTAVPA